MLIDLINQSQELPDAFTLMIKISPSHRLGSIDDLLFYRLSRLSAQTGVIVVRLCEGGYGITRREWGVIGHLREQGPLTPSGLAEHFQLDRARTSRMITSLVRKGLIVRQTVRSNRRQAILENTDQGNALYDKLMPQVQEINRRVLQALTPEEMSQLDALLAKLHQSAETLRGSLANQLPKAQRRLGQKRERKATPE